jgi:porin
VTAASSGGGAQPSTAKPGQPVAKAAGVPAAGAPAGAASNGPCAQPSAAQSDEFVETAVDLPATGGPSTDATATPSPVASGVSASSGLFGFVSTAPRSSNLLGDMWGLRTFLSQYGMTLSIVGTGEVFGNATGGARQGLEYNGVTTGTLQLDTQRAFGLNGGLFNVSGLQIHGGNLSATNLYSLQTASGIEADPATRLWELWYQQKFGDNFDVKFGQQSLDQEFMDSQNASYFVNTMFGWPMLPSADLPGGGPAYPLSALGVRARAHLTDNISVLAGVFNGSPVSDNTGDPQVRNPSGISFPVKGGVMAIAELQFMYPGSGTLVKAGEDDPLASTYRIGVWYDSAEFDDLRYDNMGLSLANPASTGTPETHRGDYAFYGVADQMVWRSAEDPDRNIDVFLRPMFTPLQDRNLISFSLNAGVTMHQPFAGRDSDTASFGVSVAQVSSGARWLDQDTAYFNPGVYSPVRQYETVLEATYQYQVMPWWQIQPDIQYVISPGAGIADPDNPTQELKNELVLGVRTNITF